MVILPLLRPILVIDDNDDDRYFARRTLTLAQVKNPIVTANDGEQAVAYLTAGPSPLPCVIFVDLKMPLMTGFDFLIWAKQQEPLRDIRLIVMSSSDEIQDHERAAVLGADGYLLKYPSPSDLWETIKHVTHIERS